MSHCYRSSGAAEPIRTKSSLKADGDDTRIYDHITSMLTLIECGRFDAVLAHLGFVLLARDQYTRPGRGGGRPCTSSGPYRPKRELAGGILYEFANHTACFMYPTPNAGTSNARSPSEQVVNLAIR